MLIFSGYDIAAAQTGLNGQWLFDISGSEKGGAVITVSGSSFTGYAFVANKGYLYPISGDYSVDAKGKITGHFTAPESALLTGKVGKGAATLSLAMAGGPKYKGTRLPSEPALVNVWQASVSKLKGFFQSFLIEPQGSSRIFTFSGTGSFEDVGAVTLSGSFFLTSKNAVYGVFTASGGVSETGFLSGKIDTPRWTFKWKLVTTDGEKLTLSGAGVWL